MGPPISKLFLKFPLLPPLLGPFIPLAFGGRGCMGSFPMGDDLGPDTPIPTWLGLSIPGPMGLPPLGPGCIGLPELLGLPAGPLPIIISPLP